MQHLTLFLQHTEVCHILFDPPVPTFLILLVAMAFLKDNSTRNVDVLPRLRLRQSL